jgi:DNA-binding transcriptional ArsR family regulator
MSDKYPRTRLTIDRLFAIGEENRLRILCYLATEGEKTVSEIASACGVALQGASHHLIVLRKAGIVIDVKRGKFHHYSLVKGVFAPGGGGPYLGIIDAGICDVVLKKK